MRIIRMAAVDRNDPFIAQPRRYIISPPRMWVESLASPPWRGGVGLGARRGWRGPAGRVTACIVAPIPLPFQTSLTCSLSQTFLAFRSPVLHPTQHMAGLGHETSGWLPPGKVLAGPGSAMLSQVSTRPGRSSHPRLRVRSGSGRLTPHKN